MLEPPSVDALTTKLVDALSYAVPVAKFGKDEVGRNAFIMVEMGE